MTGEADVVALRRNLRAWAEAPLSGFVLFGSTGEGPLVDEDERTRLLSASREVLPERLLLAGAGAESTRASIRLARGAARAGADAVLVYPPSYYTPYMTAEVLRDHFHAVADASPVPVVLYQVPPKLAGIELPAGLVGELARHPNIVGIKDSSGDLKTLAGFVDACGARCAVLVGNGAILYGALEVGARGGILAVALLAPAECAAIHTRTRAGDAGGAGRLQETVGPLHRAVVAGLGVPGIKAALDELGLTGGPPRPPLRPLAERNLPLLRDALVAAGLLGPAVATSKR